MKYKNQLYDTLKCLPEKDYNICVNLMKDDKFDDIKEIVDSDIKKLEKEQDDTGSVEENLDKLYKLSEYLELYIINFDESEYEEI